MLFQGDRYAYTPVNGRTRSGWLVPHHAMDVPLGTRLVMRSQRAQKPVRTSDATILQLLQARDVQGAKLRDTSFRAVRIGVAAVIFPGAASCKAPGVACAQARPSSFRVVAR